MLRFMTAKELVLLVEGPDDEAIVRLICEAAGYPLEQLRIVSMGGKMIIKRIVKSIPSEEANSYAVLVDLDEAGVADALALARQQLGYPAVEVFCAVPQIEAWLFADDQAAMRHARSDEARLIVTQLPLPEAIPHPRKLARELIGQRHSWEFLSRINIEYAAARSPSLRSFLVGLGRLLGIEREPITESVGRTLNRDVLSTLLSEILPSETVVWRTTGGEYTAAELRQHIEAGTDVGQQYAMDLLRVARDLLMRKAVRKAPA